eukprot:PhF_6_TR35397/c0_g1_i1/m.51486
MIVIWLVVLTTMVYDVKGRVVGNVIDLTSTTDTSIKHSKWCSRPNIGPSECVNPKQYYGVDRTVLMSKDGVFFTDPKLGDYGGVFKMDINGAGLEYIDLYNMASIMPQVLTQRIWGLHTVKWPNPLVADGTYVCEAASHQIRKATTSDIFEFAGGTQAGDKVNVKAAQAEFRNPVDFAFSNLNSAMYVVDQGNKKIKKIKFTSTGPTTATYMVTALTAAMATAPLGITVYKKYVFVTSPEGGSGKLMRITETSGIYTDFLVPPNVRGPNALWMDCDDRELLIADDTRNEIVRYLFRDGKTMALDTKTVKLKSPAGVQLAEGTYDTKKKKAQMVIYIAGGEGQMVIVEVGDFDAKDKGTCQKDPRTRSKTTKEGSVTFSKVNATDDKKTPTRTHSGSKDPSMTRTDKRDRDPTLTKIPTDSLTLSETTKTPAVDLSKTATVSLTKNLVDPSYNEGSVTQSLSRSNTDDASSTATRTHSRTEDIFTYTKSVCDHYAVYLNTTELKSTDLANEQSPEEARSIVLTL